MKRVKQFILDNSNDYLLLDGAIPTLTLGLVKEEMILYNISTSHYNNILDTFQKIADKEIFADSLISELSHGQKLILSSIIALNSVAAKIKFRNFFTSINENKRLLIKELINDKIMEGKIIETLEE